MCCGTHGGTTSIDTNSTYCTQLVATKICVSRQYVRMCTRVFDACLCSGYGLTGINLWLLLHGKLAGSRGVKYCTPHQSTLLYPLHYMNTTWRNKRAGLGSTLCCVVNGLAAGVVYAHRREHRCRAVFANLTYSCSMCNGKSYGTADELLYYTSPRLCGKQKPVNPEKKKDIVCSTPVVCVEQQRGANTLHLTSCLRVCM